MLNLDKIFEDQRGEVMDLLAVIIAIFLLAILLSMPAKEIQDKGLSGVVERIWCGQRGC